MSQNLISLSYSSATCPRIIKLDSRTKEVKSKFQVLNYSRWSFKTTSFPPILSDYDFNFKHSEKLFWNTRVLEMKMNAKITKHLGEPTKIKNTLIADNIRKKIRFKETELFQTSKS